MAWRGERECVCVDDYDTDHRVWLLESQVLDAEAEDAESSEEEDEEEEMEYEEADEEEEEVRLGDIVCF